MQTCRVHAYNLIRVVIIRYNFILTHACKVLGPTEAAFNSAIGFQIHNVDSVQDCDCQFVTLCANKLPCITITSCARIDLSGPFDLLARESVVSNTRDDAEEMSNTFFATPSYTSKIYSETCVVSHWLGSCNQCTDLCTDSMRWLLTVDTHATDTAAAAAAADTIPSRSPKSLRAPDILHHFLLNHMDNLISQAFDVCVLERARVRVCVCV